MANKTTGVTTMGSVPRNTKNVVRGRGPIDPVVQTTRQPGQDPTKHGNRNPIRSGTPGRKASYVDGKAPGPVSRPGRKQAGYKAVRPKTK